MKNNKLVKILLLISIVSVLLLPLKSSAITITRVVCDTLNSDTTNCLPPDLGDLQTSLVSLIGTAYAMIGVIFMMILIFNGVIYLIGYIEDSKYILGASIEDAQKRMTQWLIGFLMVLLSYPLINGFMKGIVGNNGCYDKLNNPTVQFIFPNVCNISGTSPTPAINPTITVSTAPTTPPTSTPPPQDAVACATWAGWQRLDPTVWCTGRCNGSTTPIYQGFDSGTAVSMTIWCNCVTNSCWTTTTP